MIEAPPPRRSRSLPLTLLIAWTTGAAVFLALRALIKATGPISPSTAAGSSIYLIVTVLVPTATALAGAWTMPRARAAGLGLTLACALPAPVLVTAWTLPAYVPRRGYFVTTFLVIGVVGGLLGALPTWLIRRRRKNSNPAD